MKNFLCLFFLPVVCVAQQFSCYPAPSLTPYQKSVISLEDPSHHFEFGPDKSPNWSWGGRILSQTPEKTETLLGCKEADQFFSVQEIANPNNYCLVWSDNNMLNNANSLKTKTGPMGLACKVIQKTRFINGTENFFYTVKVVDNTN